MIRYAVRTALLEGRTGQPGRREPDHEMPARERLHLHTGRATAPRTGPWAAPGPGPLVRSWLATSPPPGQFLPAAGLARHRWPRHRSRLAAARPSHGAGGDGLSQAALSGKPALRLSEYGGAGPQRAPHFSPATRRGGPYPPQEKVASRPLWAGGHLRLPRSAGAAGRYQRIRTSCVSPVLPSLMRTSRPARS